MAKILLLDYEKEDYELLQERNYDVEFAETNWKSLTTDILIVPKNCRIVFYQLNSENPASGLHSEDTEKFQAIIDKGGVIICFIGRCKQFQLTNFTGEYPNLEMQNYDIPNPIDSIQEPPFDQIFKEYGQFISYANTLFNVVLPVGDTISMAAWDPNLDEKLTVLASGANGLPLSVKIQRDKGFLLFLPWFGDHNNTITEMLLDNILPNISPHLFKEETVSPAPTPPPEETVSEFSEEESLPDLSEELESDEIEDTEIESSEMKPPEDEFPEFEETEAPSAEAESQETEVPEIEPEDLKEPEEESWEEPEADSVPEAPEEPPEAIEEESLEPPEQETIEEDQIEIDEEELSENIEIPESEEEPSAEERPEKTLEEELEIEDELELEEEIPSWDEKAKPEEQEKVMDSEEETEQQTPSDQIEYFSEIEKETTPPEDITEETKTGIEEQEAEEELAEEEFFQPEEIEEEPEAESQPEEKTETEIAEEPGYEKKGIPDTVLLEEEELSETEEEETPFEMEQISPPVKSEFAAKEEEPIPWMEKEEYLFPSVKEISDKIEEERIKYEEKIQKLLDSMKEAKEKEQIVFTKLLTAEGEELKQAVISTLEYLGGKKVIDVRELWKDEERGPEEDIWLLKDDKKPVEDKIKKDSVILVTVKSGDGPAKDNECSSIQKYKGRRMQEFHNTDMKAILIGNYYRQEEPKLRQDPFSEDQIAEAKIDQNALLTTFELFKAIQAEKTKKISKAEIIKQLETKMGLISFDY
ncbi:MAG: hypothetical protein JW755_06420 [Candidatus Aminicenantes bacterium]|nr:hypothetical protein [Candidatus Aminicenantes bacterium]